MEGLSWTVFLNTHTHCSQMKLQAGLEIRAAEDDKITVTFRNGKRYNAVENV